MIIVHKKLNKSRFSVCGVECRKVFHYNTYKEPDIEQRSYFWKDVNCKQCLEHLQLIKTEVIRKHEVHKSRYSTLI